MESKWYIPMARLLYDDDPDLNPFYVNPNSVELEENKNEGEPRNFKIRFRVGEVIFFPKKTLEIYLIADKTQISSL